MKKKLLIALSMLSLLSAGAVATQKEIVVKFTPGTSSASYRGSVRASEAKERGEQHDSYQLRAAKGQIMTIDASATGPVSIYVWRSSLGFNQGFMLNADGDPKLHVRFMLPADDDYNVSLDRAVPGTDIDYDVTFGIQ